MNKEDIEYYVFTYNIPVYKIKPLQDFCEYYQTHKDEIIVELDKENKLLKEKVNQLKTNWNELKEHIQDLIYNIEPKGVRVNFNCEYDSEEDYIRGMEEKSRLETLKEVLSKIQEPERGENNEIIDE